MLTRCICMTNAERSISKQGHPQLSKARLPSTHLLTGPLLSMPLRNPSDIRMTEEKQLSYGWLRFRPTWLQFLNTPKWFLFFLSQYFFTQSIVLNGIYPGSISTIERRFGYSRLVCAFSSDNSILQTITFCLLFGYIHVHKVVVRQ